MRRRLIALTILALLLVPAASGPQLSALGPTLAPGQTATLLPDGRWLLLGGETRSGLSAAAGLWDPRTQLTTPLTARMGTPRAWHTATILPDGSVLVAGGVGPDGGVTGALERFELTTEHVVTLGSAIPRAQHTATLLSDGRVLLTGGIGADGAVHATTELWDSRTGGLTPGAALADPRAAHEAILLPDGTVLLWGGISADGSITTTGEVVDAQTGHSTPLALRPPAADPLPLAPTLEASLPGDGATGVSASVVPALRFSQPLRVETVNDTTVLLSGPRGLEGATVVPAEQGRLIFVTPHRALAPGAQYTLSLNGPADAAGFLLPPMAIRFATAPAPSGSGAAMIVDPPSAPGGASGHEHGLAATPGRRADLDDLVWKGARRKGKPHSPWQDLPPLKAKRGVTALAGQVLRLTGQPLADVTITVGGVAARTDKTGRFLVPDIPAGRPEMTMDGSTASTPGKTYAMFTVHVEIEAGRTNVLPYTIWLPLIDTAHAVALPVPTVSEFVVSNPTIPGLEMRIPAGVYLRSRQTGQPLTAVALTRLDPERPPFAGAEDAKFFFTPQTHGAEVRRADGALSTVGVRFVLPNVAGWAPGVRKDLWTHTIVRDWHVFGQGTVTRDGRQLMPDPEAQFIRVPCAHKVAPEQEAPNPNPVVAGKTMADPVDVATGLFLMQKTDLVLPDVIPIVIRRTYRQGDTGVRPFGIGQSLDYQSTFVGDVATFSYLELITAPGERIRYTRISPGTGFADAVLEHTATPTAYFKSRVTWNAARPGWDLAFTDGTLHQFVDGGKGPRVIRIIDRHGNRLELTRSAVPNDQRIERIMSPNGRWVDLTWVGDIGTGFRVTQITDHIGRTVSYAYDASKRLTAVTDANGGVTEYTYDATHQMLTLKDARGIVYLTNEYDAAGRITRQTQADSTTYQFAYTLDANGKIIQTDVTDPRGNVERTTFDARGYPLSETRALGTPIAQTRTAQRDANTSHVSSTTDALNRTTAFTYDSLGNPLTVTRLSGTPQAVTTTFTYEPNFNQVVSVSDPLNHTTTFSYDSRGNLTTITNPLTQQTTLTYNVDGQPLSVTTPAGTTTLTYELGDLASITDATGNKTTRFTDPIGRVMSATTPGGQRTRYEYDSLDRLLKIIDPLGGQTQFSYDPNGNLLSLTDARNNVISYAYTNMDRLQTRTDPLLRVETSTYDSNGNLTTVTDRKSQVTSRTYDALDRLSQVSYADQSTTIYTWDAGNRLTQMTDSISGTITRIYDGLDRLTQETTPQGSVSYTYDAASRRASMTVAGQPTVSYGYDNADRLTSISQGGNVVGFAYDTAGRRTTLTLPNNISTEYAYDAASRLTGLIYKNGPTTLGTLTYTYDPNTQRRQIGGTWARTGLPQAVASASYNAANHQLTFGNQTLTYDLNGNLTSDGSSTYTWDARNRLAVIGGAGSASFGYDAVGRRRQKTINGGTTTFLYDGLNGVQEMTPSGAANLVAGLSLDEVLMRTELAGTSLLLTDALGSVLALADASGAIATEYTYEPFGVTTASGSSSENAAQFTARESDATGLYYYRARYYHPLLQRFIAEDPIGIEGGLNLFGFAGNNPLRYVDPLGLKAQICSRPLAGAFRAFGRHAYIVPDDTDPERRTLSLFNEDGLGAPTETIKGGRDDENIPGTRCRECKPKAGGKCGDVKKCLEDGRRQYFIGPYYHGGPNSNTFAATLARKCCANGFPRGLGVTIGSSAAPPEPGTPPPGAILPAR
jgi:RHS repeat-associated protein